MKNMHIDNIFRVKSLNDEYREAFQRFYDYVLSTDTSHEQSNILINIAMEQCIEGMKEKKKASLVIPKDIKKYTAKISHGCTYKEMKRTICIQDYEKLHISSIWYLFSVCVVLFFFKNLLSNQYTISYIADGCIAFIAGGFAMKSFLVRKRIIHRYPFGGFYLRMDIMALLSCIFIKIITPSSYANFDSTYLLLVISFFVMKKNIKPQFEKIIQ